MGVFKSFFKNWLVYVVQDTWVHEGSSFLVKLICSNAIGIIVCKMNKPVVAKFLNDVLFYQH